MSKNDNQNRYQKQLIMSRKVYENKPKLLNYNNYCFKKIFNKRLNK
jgi:hypothetical protein